MGISSTCHRYIIGITKCVFPLALRAIDIVVIAVFLPPPPTTSSYQVLGGEGTAKFSLFPKTPRVEGSRLGFLFILGK